MDTFNELIIDSGNASGNLTSLPILIKLDVGYAVQAVITGNPVGTLSLQGSCDVGVIDPSGAVTAVTHWTDIAGSNEPVTGAGTAMLNVSRAYYKWARLIYTSTSGTGTISARVNGKEV